MRSLLRSNRLRIVVRIGVAVVCVVAAFWLTVSRFPAPTDDFIAYWAAARLLARGEDAYGFSTLLSIQQSVGWLHATPLPTWYGPWILAAAVPVGIVPYWPARIAWLCGQLAALLGSATILGRLYGYDPQSRIPVLVTISTAAAILCVIEGQITPFSLLGVASFALLARDGKDWWAGAVLFPVTAKPLTLYLFFVALSLWIVRARRFRVAGGLALATGIASLIAIGMRPTVFLDWAAFSTTFSPLTQGYTPTIGTILRSVFNPDSTFLAYLAAIPGLVWLLTKWRRYGVGLDWRNELPMLSIVSLLTTPFAWSHDALLLLPALLQMATRYSAARHWYAWVAANAVAVALYPSLRYEQVLYILYPASVLTIRNVDDRDANRVRSVD